MASLAIAVIFVLLLWWLVDWQQVAAAWQGASPRLVAAGVALLVGSYGARALRLSVTLRLRAPAARFHLGRLVLVHNALVNVLPMRGGDFAFPLLLQRDFKLRLAEGAALIFWLRLQDALVLLTLVALVWPGLPGAFRVAAGVAALVAAARLPNLLRVANLYLPRRLRSRVARALRLALARRRREWLTWGWTLANWVLKLAAMAMLIAAFVALRPPVALAGAAAGEAAALLPVQGVAGLGTYEGAVIAALAVQGVEPHAALAAALAAHAVVLASSLLAAALISAVPSPAPHPAPSSDP